MNRLEPVFHYRRRFQSVALAADAANLELLMQRSDQFGQHILDFVYFRADVEPFELV
jgi:hypothetical protein